MFWTIFIVAILLWMVGLASAFGPAVLPLLLILGTLLGLMNYVFRRTSLN